MLKPPDGGVIRTFRPYLPSITADTPVVTLLEGNTPLIESRRLASRLGDNVRLFFKFEGLNPTCSFKDRGMTVAVSKALEEGKRIAICASTGNTSASAAAYCGRAGITCAVIVPRGHIAAGKRAQALGHGAKVIEIDGSFDDALHIVRTICRDYPVALLNSLNPHRLEGQKTAAYEIHRDLGRVPDLHAMPVGNAGNITAYWMGFCELLDHGMDVARPRMLGFQAAGAAPLVLGHSVEHPKTVATAIRIGQPARADQALAARDESGGLIEAVTDDQIITAYRMLGSLEGIFAEPASAAGVAGLLQLAARGYFESITPRADGELLITCVLTGHGLKDPDAAVRASPDSIELPADLDAVAGELELV